MKNKLDAISSLTGASKSAVSKAINHCFGVESETRERIVFAAKELGVGAERECDCYFILPDRPPKFWSEFMERFARTLDDGVRTKFNVCAQGSELLFGEYLKEAEHLGARVLLISARPTPRQYELLCEFSKRMPIFFLFDRVDITNTFCIGSDARADGELVRRRMNLPTRARVLTIGDGTSVSDARSDGFCKNADLQITRVNISAGFTAAELARCINTLGAERFDALYASVGSTREAQLALVKLKMTGCKVGGHEFSVPSALPSTAEYTVVCPDTDAIADFAARAVSQYIKFDSFPEQKYTVVPSV